MAVVRVNGVELFYEEFGAGEPLLMMHGVGLDHHYLRPWHDALADRARIIYYDHRWNGASGRVGAPDFAVWHADAAALLDQLGIAKATVYGHSYGSWLALDFAATYPQRVTRVIASGTSPAFDYPDVVMANAQRRDPAAAQILASGFAALPADDAGFEELWRGILPLYFAGPPRPEILDGTRFSAQAFARGMAALPAFSMIDRMPTMPLLAIAGSEDFITPPDQARRLVEGVPTARAVVIEDAGHFPFVEKPDAYLAAFRTFAFG